MMDGILQAEMAAHQDAKFKMVTFAILNMFKSVYQDAEDCPNPEMIIPRINYFFI